MHSNKFLRNTLLFVIGDITTISFLQTILLFIVIIVDIICTIIFAVRCIPSSSLPSRCMCSIVICMLRIIPLLKLTLLFWRHNLLFYIFTIFSPLSSLSYVVVVVVVIIIACIIMQYITLHKHLWCANEWIMLAVHFSTITRSWWELNYTRWAVRRTCKPKRSNLYLHLYSMTTAYAQTWCTVELYNWLHISGWQEKILHRCQVTSCVRITIIYKR